MLVKYNDVKEHAVAFIARHKCALNEVAVGGSSACVLLKLRKGCDRVDLFVKKPLFERYKNSPHFGLEETGGEKFVRYSEKVALFPLRSSTPLQKVTELVQVVEPQALLETKKKQNLKRDQRDIVLLQFHLARGKDAAPSDKPDSVREIEVPSFIGKLNQNDDMDRLARRFGKKWVGTPMDRMKYVSDRHDTQIVLVLDANGKPFELNIYNEDDADVFRLGLPMNALNPVITQYVTGEYETMGHQLIAMLKQVDLW